MKFLDRLRKSKATVDSTYLDDFEKQHDAYLKNIIEGPVQFNTKRSVSVTKGALNKYEKHVKRIRVVAQNLDTYRYNLNQSGNGTTMKIGY